MFPYDLNVYNPSSGNHSVMHVMLIRAHIKVSSQNSMHSNTVTVYCFHLSLAHVFITFNRQTITTIPSNNPTEDDYVLNEF